MPTMFNEAILAEIWYTLYLPAIECRVRDFDEDRELVTLTALVQFLQTVETIKQAAQRP
jgi:hypothetical protein